MVAGFALSKSALPRRPRCEQWISMHDAVVGAEEQRNDTTADSAHVEGVVEEVVDGVGGCRLFVHGLAS
jgi:hypothetical protein